MPVLGWVGRAAGAAPDGPPGGTVVVGARLRALRPAAALLLPALAVLAGCSSAPAPRPAATCSVGGVSLEPEQMQNAATIAAVGVRLGLPDHAVTVALATALQESKLRNLPYGDRDSLGLFQQRPSQGWGSPATVRTPRLAAATFYRHLARVHGWTALSVTDAAQAVQHSAAPQAYAQWEAAARTLAGALTGEAEPSVACSFVPVPHPGAAPALQAAAAAELGPAGLARPGVRGTRVAAGWLVSHAQAYGITAVSLRGRTWTAAAGRWESDGHAGAPLAWR